ncbi:MAG: hypothetical protein WD876_00355 [Candidatus Pacearchaeota archaeon]
MVRDDIVGILKTALQRGKNLQQTVQSLINSGYAKNEIDEAIQALQGTGFQAPSKPPVIQKITVPAREAKIPASPGQTTQVVSSYAYPSQPQPQIYQPTPPQFYQPQPQTQFAQPPVSQQFYPQMPYQQTMQNVSAYESKPADRLGKMITVIMVAMLIALVGILIVVFMFREELSNFINNL